MTFEKYLERQKAIGGLQDGTMVEIFMKETWNAAIKECTKIANKQRCDTPEDCADQRQDIIAERIAKEITSREA